jgi:hypothetical protein
MPSIQKAFFLEVTVEQFLDACSLTELQEIQLLIDSRVRIREVQENYRTPKKNPTPALPLLTTE